MSPRLPFVVSNLRGTPIARLDLPASSPFATNKRRTLRGRFDYAAKAFFPSYPVSSRLRGCSQRFLPPDRSHRQFCSTTGRKNLVRLHSVHQATASKSFTLE